MTLPGRQIDQYLGAGEAANVYTPLVGGGLYDGLGTATANSQGVDIPVNGMVSLTDYATGSALDNYIDTLKSLVGQKGTLYRTSANIGTSWTNARVDSVNLTRGEANYNYINAEMNFKQLDPAWYKLAQPGYWTFAGTAVSGTVAVENQGNRVNTYVQCIFVAGTAGHGTVGFENWSTGYWVLYTGSVPAGGTLIINTQTYSVKKNGTADYVHLSSSAVMQDWFAVLPGTNAILMNQYNPDTEAIAYLLFNHAYA